MSSVIALTDRRAPDERAGPGTWPGGAWDLDGVITDHTRTLLGRRRADHRGHVVPRALLVSDLLGLALAYLVTTTRWSVHGPLGTTSDLELFLVSLPCWGAIAMLHGLYHRDDERAAHCTTDDVVSVLQLVTIGVWLLVVVSRLQGWDGPRILNLAAFWLLAIVILPVGRAATRRICRGRAAYEQNTVIVGAGDVGQLICRKLLKHPEYGANVVGFVDAAPKPRGPDLPEHLTVLGGPDRLPAIIAGLDVERVVVAFSSEPVGELLPLLRRLRRLGVQIDVVPWLYELVGPGAGVHSVEGLPLVGLPSRHPSTGARMIKRAIDVAVSAMAIFVLAPLMIAIALWIRRDSPGPALFRQTRLGTGMIEFTALKFRTMQVGTSTDTHRAYMRRLSDAGSTEVNGLYKLDQGAAVTRAGRWLRTTSLDELPQLFNVLRGDMSLVGPRPCIPYELENFSAHHLERFEMPQGITGLWQVTARANATYLEALDLDVAYVRDWSLWLDLRLMLRTPLQVLRQRAATA